jgi:hypothetical protein
MDKAFKQWQRRHSKATKTHQKNIKTQNIQRKKIEEKLQRSSRIITNERVTSGRDQFAQCFDAVFFFGDLNYRLDLPRLEVIYHMHSIGPYR